MKNPMNLLLVLALLVLAACAKEELPDPAGDNSAVTTRGEYVPLKGEMTFSSVSRRLEGGTAVERWEGSGRLTHLGRTTVVVHQMVTAGVLSGTIDLTAANGDLLTWSYTGGLTSLDPATLAFTSAISFTVTGGSGRFSDADGSGTGTGAGVFPFFPPRLDNEVPVHDKVTVQVDVDGVISY